MGKGYFQLPFYDGSLQKSDMMYSAARLIDYSYRYNPLIWVTRARDGEREGISHDTNGNLDEKKILEFVGSNDIGYAELADQSGNNKHLTNSTMKAMPMIINFGRIYKTTTGKPALYLNQKYQKLENINVNFTDNVLYSYLVGELQYRTTYRGVLNSIVKIENDSSYVSVFTEGLFGGVIGAFRYDEIGSKLEVVRDETFQATSSFDGSNHKIRRNGLIEGTSQPLTTYPTFDRLVLGIGINAPGEFGINALISEFVISKSALTKETIEANQKSFYVITAVPKWTPFLVPGLVVSLEAFDENMITLQNGKVNYLWDKFGSDYSYLNGEYGFFQASGVAENQPLYNSESKNIEFNGQSLLSRPFSTMPENWETWAKTRSFIAVFKFKNIPCGCLLRIDYTASITPHEELNMYGFPINNVLQGLKRFVISLGADYTADFPIGSNFKVLGSTGNDGTYTVDNVYEVSGDTVVQTVEAIPSATADGKMFGQTGRIEFASDVVTPVFSERVDEYSSIFYSHEVSLPDYLRKAYLNRVQFLDDSTTSLNPYLINALYMGVNNDYLGYNVPGNWANNLEIAAYYAFKEIPSQDNIDRCIAYVYWEKGIQDQLPAANPYKTVDPRIL